jgi:ribosomal protein RSM22 (predicted rRNA methylase)
VSSYKDKIASLQDPSFDGIRKIAVSEIAHFSASEHTRYYDELKRGTALIETHEQLCAYLRSFGKMHKAKLIDSIKRLPTELLNQPFEIVDWGCGQAMGTINLFDFLKDQGKSSNIKKTL